MPRVPTTERDPQRSRAAALNLQGLLAHWTEVATESWVADLLGWEEQERSQRSLERRLRTAHIGRFSRSATSTGTGPRAAIDPLSKR